MSVSYAPDGRQSREQTRSCATALFCETCGRRFPIDEAAFSCPDCNKSLDIDYDYELARTRLHEVGMEERPANIWRFEELLPILDRGAQQRVGIYSGHTPLIKADRLGEQLGLRNLYLKDDSTSRPSLSYKDRVVSMSIARLLELGKDEIACVSTGNVGTAVASLSAKAAVSAYVFYPNRLEHTKAQLCRALGAQVCQVEGNYDEANRECRAVAASSGLEFANITLRPFYAEGAKTIAYEILEDLDWHAPDHIVTPAAGGTLSSRLHKGLTEIEKVALASTADTQLHIAQPAGCAPIAKAIINDARDIVACAPTTRAHSLAIGAPGDGRLVIEAVHSRKGYAAEATDTEIFAAVDLLASTEGLLTEPAGGTTIAALAKLAQTKRVDRDDVVVAVITGNGLKTLEDHPEKPWPSKIECDANVMLGVLGGLREQRGAAV